MPINCTRCEGTGFLDFEQFEDITGNCVDDMDHDDVIKWIKEHEEHDVQVCDCCGNGDGGSWYGLPGEHYNNDDPQGNDGPYAYNGGLCECH